MDDVALVDLLVLGQLIPSINLEIIEPGPEANAITMRVHERGAGITEACGTGATAACRTPAVARPAAPDTTTASTTAEAAS